MTRIEMLMKLEVAVQALTSLISGTEYYGRACAGHEPVMLR